MQAREALKKAVTTLSGAGIAIPEREASAILKDGLGINSLAVFKDDPTLTPHQEEKLEEILKRRVSREPLQYILGFVWFYGIKIEVGPGALIPRPETELVVEEVVKGVFPKTEAVSILDLCTGSGAIAIALSLNLPGADVTGTDISGSALVWAGKNMAANFDSASPHKIRFLKGDLFAPVGDSRFDIITANPPYIKEDVIETLPPEICCWEPRMALSGGAEGLDVVKRIISGAPEHLRPDGRLIMEIASGTDIAALDRMSVDAGLRPEKVIKDYSGWDRVYIART